MFKLTEFILLICEEYLWFVSAFFGRREQFALPLQVSVVSSYMHEKFNKMNQQIQILSIRSSCQVQELQEKMTNVLPKTIQIHLVESSHKILHQDIGFAQTFVTHYFVGGKKIPFWQQSVNNLLSMLLLVLCILPYL